jgi:hypothetical protein
MPSPARACSAFGARPGDGRCRLVWTVDLLPDGLAPAIGSMMDQASGFMKKALDAA